MESNNELIDYLYGLLTMAERRAFESGKDFDRNNYKWELGIEVAHELLPSEQVICHIDEPTTLFGIHITKDYYNTKNIRLWQDIKKPVAFIKGGKMKMKLYSPYEHFPEHIPKEGDKYIKCYNDGFIKKMFPSDTGKAIALLIEPRPLQPKIYEYIEDNYDDYMYVFTHDSILLNKLPNAKRIIWGGVWSWGDQEKDFTHPISMVASWKEEAPTRIARKHLAMELKNDPRVVCYGTFDGGEFVDTDTIYGKYPFSIVVENYIDDYWITEKICNCFSHKTVPIYYGARKIDELFNGKGIIHCDSIENIMYILDYITKGSYKNRITYIEDNYQRVKKYEKFETWFYNEYGGLLDEMDYYNTLL